MILPKNDESIQCAACLTDLIDCIVVKIGEDHYCNDFKCWGHALEPSDSMPEGLIPDEESGVDISFGAFIDIQLTDEGRSFLESTFKKLAAVGVVEGEYVPPVEDDLGYSRWTFLKFITTFGPALYTGCPKFFEDTAIIYPGQEKP